MSKTKKELERVQLYYLDNLRIAMTKLKNVAERTLTKIETDGVDAYYSANSDIYVALSDAWRASLGLSEMKRLQIHIIGREKDVKDD